MNREDIIRMAREAWLMDKHDCSDDWFVRADIDERNIFEFAALVAAAEREACALVAESYEPTCDTCPSGVANAIRGREGIP